MSENPVFDDFDYEPLTLFEKTENGVTKIHDPSSNNCIWKIEKLNNRGHNFTIYTKVMFVNINTTHKLLIFTQNKATTRKMFWMRLGNNENLVPPFDPIFSLYSH